MATLDEIKTQTWTLGIGKPGEVVTDLQAIDQNIRIILNTVKGSDPIEIEFGLDIYRHLDKPITQVVPGLVEDITKQIQRYETRAILKNVTADIDTADGFKITVTVKWEYFEDKATTTVIFKK